MPDDALLLAARLCVALLFLGGFAQKLIDPGPVLDMLASVGLPGWTIVPVAAFNLAGGISLVCGLRLRGFALVLAAYCLVTTYFHWQLRADPWQVTIIVKNISTAGGLLALAVAGAGRFSVDGLSMRGRQPAQRTTKP